MTNLTVESLAKEVGKPVSRLLEQFSLAGIKKNPTDIVTEGEKEEEDAENVNESDKNEGEPEETTED